MGGTLILTPVHNYHSTFIRGAFVVDDWGRTLVTCAGSSLDVPLTCGPTAGDMITEYTSPVGGPDTTFGMTGQDPVYNKAYQRAWDAANGPSPVSDVVTSLDSLSINNGACAACAGSAYFMYDGNALNGGAACQIADPGSGLGGLDLTEGFTRNHFVYRFSSSDQPSTIDITVYNTTGAVNRINFGSPEITGTTFPEPYGIQQPSGFDLDWEIWIPFGDPNIYTNVDAMEIRVQQNDAVAFYFGFDSGAKTLITGFAGGCQFQGTWDHMEWHASPVCGGLVDGDTRKPGACAPFPGLLLINDGEPLVFDSANYRPLPYGNTFSVSAVDVPSPFFGPRLGYTGSFGDENQLEHRIFVGEPKPFDTNFDVTIDFRTGSDTGPGQLFRRLNVTFDMFHFMDCSTMGPFMGPTVTPLGADLMPIGPAVLAVGPTMAVTATATYTFDAGSNILRGFRYNAGSTNCTLTGSGPESFDLDITYVLEADGDCPLPASAFTKTVPCKDVVGTVFYDTNGDGVLDMGEPLAGDIRVFAAVDGEASPRTSYDTHPISGQYMYDCIEETRDMTITVTPPPGFQISTGPNPLVYTTTVQCDQQVPPIGLAEAVGVCGNVYEDLNANGMQDGPETGIPGVPIRVTQASNPAIVFDLVTDMSGNFQVDLVGGNDYDVEIIDFPPPVGWNQTEGVPLETLSFPLGANKTLAGPFGFHRPPLPCNGASASKIVIDAFTTQSIPGVVTSPSQLAAEGYMAPTDMLPVERDIRVTAHNFTGSALDARFLVNALWQHGAPSRSTIFFQYDGVDGSLTRNLNNSFGDLTAGGVNNALCFRTSNSPFGDVHSKLLFTARVGNSAGDVEEIQTVVTTGLTALEVPFYFQTPIATNASFIELEIEILFESNVGFGIGPPVDGDISISFDELAAKCTACQTLVSFEEVEFGNTTTTPISFSSLENGINRMPAGNTVVLSGDGYGIFPVPVIVNIFLTTEGQMLATNASLPADHESLLIDLVGLPDPSRLYREVSGDIALVITEGACTFNLNTVGPRITWLDVDLNPLPSAPVDEEPLLIPDTEGVLRGMFLLDAGYSVIRGLRINVTGVQCDGATQALIGVDNLLLTLDQACMFPEPVPLERASDDTLPRALGITAAVMVSGLVVAMFALSAFGGGPPAPPPEPLACHRFDIDDPRDRTTTFRLSNNTHMSELVPERMLPSPGTNVVEIGDASRVTVDIPVTGDQYAYFHLCLYNGPVTLVEKVTGARVFGVDPGALPESGLFVVDLHALTPNATYALVQGPRTLATINYGGAPVLHQMRQIKKFN